MSSPTVRTIAKLKAMGYLAGRTEHFNTWVKIRQDLFGCIDVIGLKQGVALLCIQCTTAEHVAHRLTKAKETLALIASTGNVAEVWGWSKRGAQGTRKLWKVRRVRVYATGETFEEIEED
jgi:hypothetical protein